MATNKSFGFPMALGVLAALSVGCGDDESSNGGTTGTNGDNGNNSTGDGGMTTGGSQELDLTLVPILDQDDRNPIAAPHDIYLLDTATGEAIPGFEDPIKSKPETGKVVVTGLPDDVIPTLHVVGNPNAADPTYDAVTVNQAAGSGEFLLRISTVGLAMAAEQTGGFTPSQDRAAMAGTVNFTPGGIGNPRMGGVGCAQVFLDDSTVPLDDNSDQRYNGSNGLPVPAEAQNKTDTSGRFYFGNMPTGQHTLRVSLDEGATFVTEKDFVVARSRDMALGPEKIIIYLIGLDVDAETNPTPATCDGVY